MSVYRLFNRAYRDYVRSDEILRLLNIIILSAAIGTFLFSAQGGVAFTGFASTLGAGEFAFGLISALPVLAGLMQIYASHLAVKTGKYKSIFMIGGIVQRVSWIIVAFIPYIFPVEQSRLWSLIVLVTLAAMGGSFVAIAHTTLLGSVVPIEIRGRYITTRQRVCMAASLIAGLCFAFLLDNIPGFLGYTIVFAFGGVAGLADILMYSVVKFDKIPHKPEGFSMLKGIRSCFTAPVMRDYLVFWTVWNFAIHLSGPFFNKYAIDVLALSYTSIILFGQIMAQLTSLIVVSRWGVLIDRYGGVNVMLISALASSFGAFVWLFAVPGSVWPLFVFSFFGGIFWCANEACMFNMQLSHTPTKGRPAALAVYAVVTSIAIALALISGGALLELFSPIMYRLDLTVFGTPFDHYKVLFCITIIIRFFVVLVFLPRVWNEKGMSIREAYSKMYEDMRTRIQYERSRFRLPRFRR